ncbi:MAG: hypothetical protein P8010_18705 [Desulfosarcinaceae bacterium]
MRRYGLLPVLLLLATTFWACYESPGVTIHEPGVYKGAQDPLLAKQHSDRQLQQLRDRLALIQMDR